MAKILVLGDADLLTKVEPIIQPIAVAAEEGQLANGGMIYEYVPQSRHTDSELHWWVQAECMIGEIYLYKHHNKQQYLAQAIETWQYIQQNIVDHSGGEWYWSRLADGSVNRTDDKAGFWKCPYHNSRMCIEIIETLGK